MGPLVSEAVESHNYQHEIFTYHGTAAINARELEISAVNAT
jgi:hypothetical protein